MAPRNPARAGRWMKGLLVGMGVLVASAAAQAQTPVRFSLDWRWEGPAAPFAVALDKGYYAEDLTDAWTRYCTPPPGESATSATSATPQVSGGESVADTTTTIRHTPAETATQPALTG